VIGELRFHVTPENDVSVRRSGYQFARDGTLSVLCDPNSLVTPKRAPEAFFALVFAGLGATAGAGDFLGVETVRPDVCAASSSSRGIPPFESERPFCGLETVTGGPCVLAS